MKIQLLFLCLICFSLGCSNNLYKKKVKFDIDQIDDNGLRKGVSVSYEYCIPKSSLYKNLVLEIDPEVKFQEKAKGRIGCKKDQILCLSHTHQNNFKKVLKNLSKQDFIDQIFECFFE